MANTSRPNGFRPVKYLNGTPWNGAFRIYAIPAAEGTAEGRIRGQCYGRAT